jgi:hypothetical protein
LFDNFWREEFDEIEGIAVRSSGVKHVRQLCIGAANECDGRIIAAGTGRIAGIAN